MGSLELVKVELKKNLNGLWNCSVLTEDVKTELLLKFPLLRHFVNHVLKLDSTNQRS